MKNLDKKIDIYKHELDKLKAISTADIVLEYNCPHVDSINFEPRS
jgi:hypothetical protein